MSDNERRYTTDRLEVSVKQEQLLVTPFYVVYMPSDGMNFGMHCCFRGQIVRRWRSHIDRIRYSIIFNESIVEWDKYLEKFKSFDEAVEFLQSDSTLLRILKEHAQRRLSNDTTCDSANTYKQRQYINIYRTILGSLRHKDGYTKTPHFVYEGDSISVSVTKTNPDNISLYEKSPTRILDACIYWEGVGTVMFKISMTTSTGKFILIPIAMYRNYDGQVKFWNDQRLWYLIRPETRKYDELLRCGMITEINRQKLMDVRLSYECLSSFIQQVATTEFMNWFKYCYFWKVADAMEILDIQRPQTAFDYIYSYFREDEFQKYLRRKGYI